MECGPSESDFFPGLALCRSMKEPMSEPDGSLPRASSMSLLTTREWLRQEIPIDVEDFGIASSRRNEAHVLRELPRLVDDYVQGFDSSEPRLLPFDPADFQHRDNTEQNASSYFAFALRRVGVPLGLSLTIRSQEPIPGSRGPDEGVDQRVARLAASPTQYADYVVTVGGKQVLVVEMERPGLFRRNVLSPIPCLHFRGQRVVGLPLRVMVCLRLFSNYLDTWSS